VFETVNMNDAAASEVIVPSASIDKEIEGAATSSKGSSCALEVAVRSNAASKTILFMISQY
jgi:hypothetical protein